MPAGRSAAGTGYLWSHRMPTEYHRSLSHWNSAWVRLSRQNVLPGPPHNPGFGLCGSCCVSPRFAIRLSNPKPRLQPSVHAPSFLSSRAGFSTRGICFSCGSHFARVHRHRHFRSFLLLFGRSTKPIQEHLALSNIRLSSRLLTLFLLLVCRMPHTIPILDCVGLGSGT